MKKPEIIVLDDEKYELYFKNNACVTVPFNMLLEDSLNEMFENIGKLDVEYLQELYNDNKTFYV